jgi:hypothetical protein
MARQCAALAGDLGVLRTLGGLSVKTRRIKPDERVPVTFNARERILVLDHTFAGGEVIEPLEAAREARGKSVVRYTLEDLDELLGYVAAEANHSKNKKLQAELDALYDRLQAEMQSYDDGQWQDPSITLGVTKKPKLGTPRVKLALVKRRDGP